MTGEIVDATAAQVVGVVEQVVDLPWPDGDEPLEWELEGLEGQTTWMTHILPLASTPDTAAIDALADSLVRLADQRWVVRHRFDATRFTDDATTDPASYDRRSAPASLVRALGADTAVWWRYDDHAVLLVDSSAAAPDARKLVVLVLPEQWMEGPGTEEAALGSPLVADFLSGDRSRILSALWEVMRTRDPAVLTPLVTALPAIERATADVDLGGALVSNASNLERAFQRIELFGTGACLCTAYPAHQFHDPAKEEHAGHVRIVGTVPNERQWEPDRICECTACGKRYQVEQGEYHYTWWKWTALD
ncbi:MAG TPA: hypothetical protein VM575_06905 [Nocardioides sp.]|jgi:hypothetical protein|nr:hypothetical protein [Nocardioides sp.]